MSKRDTSDATPAPEISALETSSTGDLSPVQLTALTALAIFVGEAMIMFILPVFGEIPVTFEAMIDAVLLTLITAPVLSFLLFRPMVLHIEERKNAEQALVELAESLEHRVVERTEDLTRSNKALNYEVAERKATEERLRRSNSFIQRLIESAPCLMATIDVSTYKCNYVNGRVEDFLGFSPETIIATREGLLQTIADSETEKRWHSMINDLAMAPHGEIVRGEFDLADCDRKSSSFRVAMVVASRTSLGEAEEVLFVATPVDTCT